MKNGQYYLIGYKAFPKATYIAIQASVEKTDEVYASISLDVENKIYLYDINGRIVSFVDASDDERIKLENSIAADIADYNGQIVYFENVNASYEGEQFTILEL